jgi:glycerol-3-phosphate dehydrogenase
VPRAPAELFARCLVNAAGPWAVELLRDIANVVPRRALRLVKGSHVVVPRLYEGAHAYILQQPDRRVVFLIPFERDFTLLGTTELVVERPAHLEIEAAEVDYLCAAAARFLREAPTPRDVRWSYAGLRPLLDDGRANASAVTRDYALPLDTDGAPLLSVFGGKLTTHRRLAERAVDLLAPMLGGDVGTGRGAWTAGAPLPGGALPPGVDADARIAAALRALRAARPELAESLARGVIDRHGSEALDVLGAGAPREALPGITEAEVEFSVAREWTACADDLLWRRSKAGLVTSPEQRAWLETFISSRLG